MRSLLVPALAGCFCLASAATCLRAEDAADIVWPEPDGSLVLRRPFGGSEIVLSASTRTAGAIDGLTWGGTRFVTAFDHGREMQSASSFDGYGECHNPTEAGSDADGAGARSTSLLTGLRYGRNWFETDPLSDHMLRKRVALGLPGIPNAIAVHVRFDLPSAYRSATFEALTGCMPSGFTTFRTFDPTSRALAPLSHEDGEQGLPVILATPDGRRAMGVWSPGLPNAGYGRFDFSGLADPDSATVKWNCVFRQTAPAAGPHAFACYAVVGTLADVQEGLAAHAARLR